MKRLTILPAVLFTVLSASLGVVWAGDAGRAGDGQVGRPKQADLLERVEALIENSYWDDDAIAFQVPPGLGNQHMLYSASELDDLTHELIPVHVADAISRWARDVRPTMDSGVNGRRFEGVGYVTYCLVGGHPGRIAGSF